MCRHVFSLACLSVVLAACAANPQSIVDQGRRHEFASTASALNLVRCATLNASSFSSAYTADWSAMVRPGTYQAVVTKTPVRPGSWPYQPFIVARAVPMGQGSQMQLFMAGDIDPQSEADWIERLRGGCESDARATIVVPVVPMVPRDAQPAVNPPPPPVPASPPPPPSGRQPRG